jgi:hypothetical protein
MTEPAFSPEMEKALNSYAVPPAPAGFSDRLMARIASGDTGTVATAMPELPARRRTPSPWRRTSRIVGSVALFSLATATAAAAGVFGHPVYLPGITEALVKAEIVEAPSPKPLPVRVAAQSTEPEVATPVQTEVAQGSAAVTSRLTELREDPRFAELTPKQKLAVAGREVRTMVRSGEVTRQEARTAVREMARNADPATKAAMRKALAERRAQRLERRNGVATAPVAASPEPLAISAPAAAEEQGAAATTEPLPALAAGKLTEEQADAVRERLRTASPEQRAALRNALRERRQLRQQRRAQ